MKKILFFLFLLPALASAQTAKDTVNVLSDAEISQGTARDSLKFYYVEGTWKKLRLDSLAKYTRVKLVGDKGDITVSNNGDTWSIDAGAVVWEDLAQAVKDSIGAGGGGGGGGGVTSITAGTGLTGGTITTSGTIAADTNFLITVYDTTAMLAPYLREADTLTLSNRINLKLNISDTTAMLAPYLREADTLTLSNRINLKLNISDTTAMLAPYLREADTLTLSNRINLKLNISDTTAMLAPYLREADTLTLSNRINLKQNILIAGTGITISNDTISSTGGSGVADGDKGDIDVTSSGTVWTIDTSAVTGLKIASTTVTGNKLAITGISGDAAHLVGAISGGNADTVSIGSGLTLSGGVLSASGGGGGSGVITGVVAGEVAYGIGADSLGGESALFYSATNNRLSVGGQTSPTATLQVTGTGTTTGETLIVEGSGGVDNLKVLDNGRIEIGRNTAITTQATSTIIAEGSDSNIGIALVPKGTGAITAGLPDGTAGNARGANAVDFQTLRTQGSDRVASGAESVVVGGRNNRATAQGSSVLGGRSNSATGIFSYAGGDGTTASGQFSFAHGNSHTVSSSGGSALGSGHTVSGENATAVGGSAQPTLYGQFASSSSVFAARGDAQTSDIRLFRSITGTAQAELVLDGTTSTQRAILNLTGATNGRVWNARIQVVAVVQTLGSGPDSILVGSALVADYQVGIKRIGNNTSLIGSVQQIGSTQADNGMGTAVITIDANDTNEALRVQFTPPFDAVAATVIRVVATVYLTEVGY